jgi:hypothetical protein
MVRVGAHVDARAVASREPRVTRDGARALAHGSAARRNRARNIAGSAVGGIAFEVDAFAAAVFEATAAVCRATALRAHLPGGTTATTRSAVLGVSGCVDARVVAASEASVADDVARAGGAARTRVGRFGAHGVALSAVPLVRARVHANVSARREAIVTSDGARSRYAACRTGLGCRTSRFAGAAVRVRGREIDASAVAVGRARRARVAAQAGGADLAQSAALVAGAAVLGVARKVDARVAAFLEAGVATRGASAELACRDAIGRGPADDAAAPAIQRVLAQVRANAVAVGEALVALVVAAPVRAGRSRPWRRRAQGAARSAIFRIAGEYDAASVADGFSLETSDGWTNANVSFGIANVAVDAAFGGVARTSVEHLGEVARAAEEDRAERDRDCGQCRASCRPHHGSATSTRPRHASGAQPMATSFRSSRRPRSTITSVVPTTTRPAPTPNRTRAAV